MIDYSLVAKYCLENWRELSLKVIKIADEVCNNIFTFDMPWDMERSDMPFDFGDKIDWFYKRNNDPEYLFQLNRHHFFVSLAQAYRLTGDEKYVVKLKELMLEWIENIPCPEENCVHPWRSLETGLRGENWTLAIDIAKDCSLIDDDFLGVYRESLYTHAEALMRFHSTNNYLSNWGVIETHGLFDIAVELGEEKYLTTALSRLYTQADIEVMADGVHWEQSCLYHNEVLCCFLDVIIRARKNDIKLEQRFLNQVKKLAMVNVYWIKPNNMCPLFGDSDYNDLRDIITRSAIVFTDPVMKSVAFDKADFETVWLTGVKVDEHYQSIDTAKPDFTSVSLSDSGNMILRSSYDNTSNYLAFRNGYTGAGHAHEDKLSFELSAGEDDVLVDCGRYSYMWNKERKYLKSFEAHNTVSVDGKHFVECDGWGYKALAPTVKGTFLQKEKYEYLTGSHLGYFDKKDSVFVTRHIVWLKPDIYILIDEFTAAGRHKYSQHFNFAPGGMLTADNALLTYQAKSSVTFIKSISSEFERGTGRYSYHYNDIENIDTAKTTITGKGNTVAVTVIVTNKNNQYKNVEIKQLDVFADDKKTKLQSSDAIGIEIVLDDSRHTVVLTFKELMRVLYCNDKLAASKITWYENEELNASIW